MPSATTPPLRYIFAHELRVGDVLRRSDGTMKRIAEIRHGGNGLSVRFHNEFVFNTSYTNLREVAIMPRTTLPPLNERPCKHCTYPEGEHGGEGDHGPEMRCPVYDEDAPDFLIGFRALAKYEVDPHTVKVTIGDESHYVDESLANFFRSQIKR